MYAPIVTLTVHYSYVSEAGWYCTDSADVNVQTDRLTGDRDEITRNAATWADRQNGTCWLALSDAGCGAVSVAQVRPLASMVRDGMGRTFPADSRITDPRYAPLTRAGLIAIARKLACPWYVPVSGRVLTFVTNLSD